MNHTNKKPRLAATAGLLIGLALTCKPDEPTQEHCYHAEGNQTSATQP